ncbi:MAG: DUF4089 domain-containing protein [Acetobacter papayae]
MSTSAPFPSEEDVQALARLARLELAPDHLPGIVQNMRILQHYSDLIEDFPLSDHCAPAFGYMP